MQRSVMKLLCHCGLAFSIGLAGCGGELASTEASAGLVGVEEGSRQAIAVINFVNGPEATLERLDHEVGLNKRAAS